MKGDAVKRVYTMLPEGLEGIPASLRPLRQWVLWRYEERDGSFTKVPYAPGGGRAKVNDPSTWGTLEEVFPLLEEGGFDGIGLVLCQGGGIVGLDLDWKAWTGEGLPPVVEKVAAHLGSYTEWSPSRRGAHILLRGVKPGGRSKASLGEGVELEIYAERRFLTFTGLRWSGYPKDLVEAQEKLEELYQEIFRPRFITPERNQTVPGTSPKRLRALLETYAQKIATTPEGSRHLTLVRYARAAGGLIPHGLDPQETEATLVAAATKAGLPEREAREAVRWGLEVGQSLPLELGNHEKDLFRKPGIFRKPNYEESVSCLSQESILCKHAVARRLRKRRGWLR